MLTSKDLDALGSIITDCYSSIETELIAKVCKSIASGKGTSNVNTWRLQKLRHIGKLTDELKRTIAAESMKGIGKVDEAITEAIRRSCLNDDIVGKAALDAGRIKMLVPCAESSLFDKYKKAMLKNARNALNLTNTTALQIAKKEYQDAINKAFISVNTGSKTLTDAISESCHQLGGTGLRVDYISEKGKHTTYSLDASIRRDIVTSVNQTCAEITKDNCKNLGTDLVVTTSHGGSRPEHEEWQGQVFSLSGKSDKYPSLVAGTGYGTVTGLCGANCAHSFYPYFEGLDDPMASKPDEQTKKANDKAYQESQEQRRIERQIRHWKRQWVADEAGATGMSAQSGKRLSDAKNRMKDFIDRTDRKRRFERERIT